MTAAQPSAAAFRGFPPEAAGFLADLKANNDRDWFNAHKAAYETAIKAPAEAFVAALQPDLEALAGRPLRPKIFRLHRDVRFAKDKRPYNAYLHIGFMGEDESYPGFYFGLEPDHITVGGGCFELAGARLDAFRAAIDDARAGERLARLLAALAAEGFETEAPALKRVPAPYPADHPRGDLLRRKGLPTFRDTPITPNGAIGDGASCLADFRKVAPLNSWLSDALGG